MAYTPSYIKNFRTEDNMKIGHVPQNIRNLYFCSVKRFRKQIIVRKNEIFFHLDSNHTVVPTPILLYYTLV